MYNSTDAYKAELEYRREQVRIDRRPLWTRRRNPLTRNRVTDNGTGSAA